MDILTSIDGNVNASYDYDAFGNEAFPDPDDNNPFRYCGEYYDTGTNRLYLRARESMHDGSFLRREWEYIKQLLGYTDDDLYYRGGFWYVG